MMRSHYMTTDMTFQRDISYAVAQIYREMSTACSENKNNERKMVLFIFDTIYPSQ